jgi:hypothetical protein
MSDGLSDCVLAFLQDKKARESKPSGGVPAVITINLDGISLVRGTP